MVHKDSTARVHEVNKRFNPKFYRLIRYFEKFTGYPIVLNTSLNLKEEPIVENPDQALEYLEQAELMQYL